MTLKSDNLPRVTWVECGRCELRSFDCLMAPSSFLIFLRHRIHPITWSGVEEKLGIMERLKFHFFSLLRRNL